jgi:hypothetical protein
VSASDKKSNPHLHTSLASLDGTSVLWIRIRVRKDPHHFGNLDPHKIKIRIRIKFCKPNPEPDPNLHKFADVLPKCMEFEPILALFQGFEPFFKS